MDGSNIFDSFQTVSLFLPWPQTGTGSTDRDTREEEDYHECRLRSRGENRDCGDESSPPIPQRALGHAKIHEAEREFEPCDAPEVEWPAGIIDLHVVRVSLKGSVRSTHNRIIFLVFFWSELDW